MDVYADCAYTGFVQHDVTSLLHVVMHTLVIIMTTVMPNSRFCKFRDHLISFKIIKFYELNADKFMNDMDYVKR